MTRVALDSNILIYAELEPDSDKGKRCIDLILRAARDGVIPAQVLGEYLRFVQRRVPAAFAEAIRQARIYQTAFLTPPTTVEIINRASDLAHAHRLQFWDCIVCAAATQTGAKALLTEDLQDGRVIDGLHVINPLASANLQAIDALLPR
jgi:predicted nucleic acid-binding protein